MWLLGCVGALLGFCCPGHSGITSSDPIHPVALILTRGADIGPFSSLHLLTNVFTQTFAKLASFASNSFVVACLWQPRRSDSIVQNSQGVAPCLGAAFANWRFPVRGR